MKILELKKKKNSVNTSYFFLRKKIDLHRSVIFHIVVDKHTEMKGKLREIILLL